MSKGIVNSLVKDMDVNEVIFIDLPKEMTLPQFRVYLTRVSQSLQTGYKTQQNLDGKLSIKRTL